MRPITRTCNLIGDIAVDPVGDTLVVTHPCDNAVSILDTNDPAATSVITLDGGPVAVAAVAGRAFIATTSASHDAASVLDLDTWTVLSAHPLEFTITGMAVSRDGARVFTGRTGRLRNDIGIVDLATEAVTSIALTAREAATSRCSGLTPAGIPIEPVESAAKEVA